MEAEPCDRPASVRYKTWNIVSGELVRTRARSSLKHTALIVESLDTRWKPAAITFEVFISILIIANIFMVALMSCPFMLAVDVAASTEPADDASGTAASGPSSVRAYWCFELISVIIFSIEYCLRCWSSAEDPRYNGLAAGNAVHPLLSRLRWALSAPALIDLFVLIPYICDLAFSSCYECRYYGFNSTLVGTNCEPCRTIELLQVLRIASVMRFERSFSSFGRVRRVLATKGAELFVSAFVSLAIVFLCGGLVYYIESPYNADFISIPAGLYWAILALSGNYPFYPITIGGQAHVHAHSPNI